jgi:hypothetical protein
VSGEEDAERVGVAVDVALEQADVGDRVVPGLTHR